MNARQFGLSFNRIFEQWMFLFIPGSLILGFLCADGLLSYVPAVPYLFAFVTFTMGLGCGFGEIKLVFRKPLPMAVTLVVAHALVPLAAYGIGSLIFGSGSPFVIGLVLFALIPLGVSAIMWVGVSGGSVAMILAMVVIDSLLSPFLVPTGIHVLFGESTEVDTTAIMIDLLLIIVAPTIAGMLLHQVSQGKIQPALAPIAPPISKLCFVAIVALNAAAIEPHVTAMRQDMAKLVPAVLLLVGINYAAGYFGAKPFKSRELETTLSYAAGIRNISLGIVIALAYFSPQSAVPVVLSILVQQPIATLHHYVLHKLHNTKTSEATQGQVG
jgi:bile acid:Na+ symporter, BASS family